MLTDGGAQKDFFFRLIVCLYNLMSQSVFTSFLCSILAQYVERNDENSHIRIENVSVVLGIVQFKTEKSII